MDKKVELIIGSGADQISLDLEANAISIALQYSIDDIRDIDKKNTNYSKTITLPGTKKNNKAFSGLFDVNATFDTFDPNLKSIARIVVDSSPVLEGYLQLKSVKKLNNADLQGNKISYEVVVFDDSIDFIQSIGDKLVSELDFSDKNHAYNRTNIENAWTAHTYEDIYQYPLLDKITEGYNTEDFKPAFYHKALLLKIAEDATYTLEGSFIDNENEDVNSSDYGVYHKEIILWDGDTPTITDAEALERQYKAGVTGTTTISLGTYQHSSLNASFNNRIKNNLNYDTITPDPPYFDNTGGYTFNNPGGADLDFGQWECTNSGKYDFIIKGNFSLDYNKFSSGVIGNVYSEPDGFSATVFGGVLFSLIDVTTGVSYGEGSAVLGTFQDLPSGTPGGTLQADVDLEIRSQTIPLNAKVKLVASSYSSRPFGFGVAAPFGVITTDIDVELKFNPNSSAEFFNKTIQVENITDGDEIEISQYLPKEIKQKDIISDIIKRYNVYIRKHPTKNKTLILESRDEYYKNNTTVLDWTQKKDYSSEDNIKFLSDLQNKEILFTYKEANDLTASDDGQYNEQYTQSTGDIYGQKKISFDNDFVKGTKKVESIFSTTPLIFRGDTDTKNDVVVPSVGSQEKKRKPILCYWGGLVECKDKEGVNSDFKITWGDDTNATVYTTYPYSGHWDNPYDPTIDIHYGVITYEFYGVLINDVTDNNLFNRYWRNYYDQISNGKLITSSFYLKETDINFIKDNLNARIFIKDSYYNVNKIIDYKPLEDGLTKVELLRIEEGSDFTPTTTTNPFDFTNIDLSQAVRSVGPFISNPTNQVSSINVMALGQRNYVGNDSSGIVNGNDNVINGNSTGVNITGDNNTVGAGVSNVTVIGNDIEATDSDTTIIGPLTINSDGSTSVNDEPARRFVYFNFTPVDITTLVGNQFTFQHDLSATEVTTVSSIDVIIVDNSGFIYRLNHYLTSDFTSVGGTTFMNIFDFFIKFNPTAEFSTLAAFNAATIKIKIEYTPD